MMTGDRRGVQRQSTLEDRPDTQDGAAGVVYRPFRGSDAEAFRRLNEEWIERYFRLEEKDRRTLGDPEGEILDKGGAIYTAEKEGAVVGCVALLRHAEGDFELSKMVVAPAMRGRGVGRGLLEYTLAEARAAGVRRVFLGSNSVLAGAVRMYEALGFEHVLPETLPYLGYTRADVYMAMHLRPGVKAEGARRADAGEQSVVGK